MKKIYLVDCGHFLSKADKEYTCYDGVYDMKHAYVDEFQEYHENLETAQVVASMFVSSAEGERYGIVSESQLRDGESVETKSPKGEEYLPQNVVFSIARENGKIIENFVENQKK